MDLKSVGSTDDQSRQQRKGEHRFIRRSGLNVVGSTGDATPDDPTKSKSNAGAVVQRCFKTDSTNTG